MTNIKRIKDFDQLSSEHISSEDVLLIMDDPNGSSVTKKITIGQLKNILYTPHQLNPSGMARIVTVKSSGNFEAQARSSTGYIATRWWDGSVDVFGLGTNTISYVCSKAIPTTSNWSKSAPKEIFMWSCSSGNATQSGYLISIAAPNQSISSLDIKGLSGINELYISDNKLTYLDISTQTQIAVLSCNSNNLTELNITNNTYLNNLDCSYNNILVLDTSNNSNLISLDCSHNSIMAMSINSHVTDLNCSYNNLESIRAIGNTFGGVFYYDYYGVPYKNAGADLSNNNLSANAINRFYEDLDPNPESVYGYGVIDIENNPGSASDNPSIATNKGYIVLGT